MKQSIDLPAMTISVDFDTQDGRQPTNKDLAAVALTAIARATGAVVMETYGVSEQELLEMYSELGISAQESIDSQKG